MTIPRTMRAALVTSKEGPRALALVEREVPSPREGEVLLRVRAAGVNYADCAQSRGHYVGGPTPPYVPGLEVCGDVVARGDGVTIDEGARVIATGLGSFAEYMRVRASSVMPLPKTWTPEQGASFFVAWMTAYGCLHTCGQLARGQTVVVHAAAGGVGQAAIRLAKHAGARVIATASSTEKLAVAKKLGADVLVDYTKDDFVQAARDATGGEGADLVLEMVGGDVFEASLAAVRPFGRVVVFGAASGRPADANNVNLIFRPVSVIGFHLTVLAEKRPDLFMAAMQGMHALIAEGVVVPDGITTYPLDDVARALVDMESRTTTGKLVIVP